MPPLIRRFSDGTVDAVLVATWGPAGTLSGPAAQRRGLLDVEADEGARLWRHPNNDVPGRSCNLFYDPVGAGFHTGIDVDLDGMSMRGLVPVSTLPSAHPPAIELLSGRVRWAVRELGLRGVLPYPLWRAREVTGPLVLVVDRGPDDPGLASLVQEADEALHALRTGPDRKRERGVPSDEAGSRFDAIVASLLGALGARVLWLDDGTEADDEVLSIERRYDKRRWHGDEEPAGHVARVQVGYEAWYENEFSAFPSLWAILSERTAGTARPETRSDWSEEQRPFVLVPRPEKEAWMARQLMPGTLSIDEEEANLLRMLGEPLPLALPGPELVAWAEQREAEGGRDGGGSP